MAAQSVREVLGRMGKVHGRLSASYDELRETVSDDRVRVALQCMAAHQRKVCEWVEHHVRYGDRTVLAAWIQFAPGFALDRVIQTGLHLDMSPEEVLEAAMGIDQQMLALYRRVLDSVSGSRAREMFTDLLRLVESKDLQFTRTAVEMGDE